MIEDKIEELRELAENMEYTLAMLKNHSLPDSMHVRCMREVLPAYIAELNVVTDSLEAKGGSDDN